MTNKFASRVAVFAASLLISLAAFASETPGLQQSGTDMSDKASLQRGAQLYMNYCAGCHSMEYVRYARIGEDLGLTEEKVQANLNLTGAK